MSAEPVVEAVPQPVPETAEKAPEPTATETPAETTEQQPETPAEPAADKPTEAAAGSTEKDETAEKKAEPEAPAKPAYLTKVPGLSQFFDSLPAILEKTGHSEMWGVPLKDSDDVPTVNVLIKFLRANEGNVKLAEEQLTKALEWRKEINPVELAKSATFSAKKFGGLGYITSYIDPTFGETVFTWNLYGSVKDLSNTFGDLDECVSLLLFILVDSY
jgi:phosphatidylinositol transfer protein SFH5